MVNRVVNGILSDSMLEGVSVLDLEDEDYLSSPLEYLSYCQYWRTPKVRFMEGSNLAKERKAGRLRVNEDFDLQVGAHVRGTFCLHVRKQ